MPSARPKSTTLALTLVLGSAAAFIGREAWHNGGQPLLAMGPTTHQATAEITADGYMADSLESLPATLRRDRTKLSYESDALRKARNNVPDTFRVYQTRRFVVLSDAKPRWTEQQGRLLERSYHQFHRFTRRLGISPRPVRHKLVCVLFQEYDDYRRFARNNDGVTADWISGYYSPKNDRVVFYNIETNPDFAEVFGHAGTSDNLARAHLRDEYTRAATATVVHEAVHQLAFHTRIQSPQIQNPLWLSEGLATAFETDKPNQAFGPEKPYDLRETQFKELFEEDSLIPLRKLVSYSQMPDNDDATITAVYHQSYALVRWMARLRRTDLRKFMQTLRTETPGRPTPQRHLQLFEKAFGDVDRLERAWLRYEGRKN